MRIFGLAAHWLLLGLLLGLLLAAASNPVGWAHYYDSEREWKLAAHLKAVERCDQRDPRTPDQRRRCEELHMLVFLWGLERGIENPSLDQYLANAPEGEATCVDILVDAEACRQD